MPFGTSPGEPNTPEPKRAINGQVAIAVRARKSADTVRYQTGASDSSRARAPASRRSACDENRRSERGACTDRRGEDSRRAGWRRRYDRRDGFVRAPPAGGSSTRRARAVANAARRGVDHLRNGDGLLVRAVDRLVRLEAARSAG